MSMLSEKIQSIKLNLDNLRIDDYKLRFHDLQLINDSISPSSNVNYNDIFRLEVQNSKSGYSLSDINEAKKVLLTRLKQVLMNSCDTLETQLQNRANTVNQGSFINQEIIESLKYKINSKYDKKKLIQYLLELNSNYASNNIISCIMIVRAIMNFVPPIFNESSFGRVVQNYKPNPLKGRNDILNYLSQGARPLGDLHNHDVITKNDSLPTLNQIDPYKPHFEYLIQEVIKNI